MDDVNLRFPTSLLPLLPSTAQDPHSPLQLPRLTTVHTRRCSVKDITLARDYEVGRHGAEAEAITRRQARAVGLLDHLGERRFDAFNSIAKYVFSYADLERLVAASSWLAVLFFLDDQFDEDHELGRDQHRVCRLIDSFLELLERGVPIDDQPLLTRITLDARGSFARLASPAWFAQLCRSTRDYLERGVADAVRAWQQRDHESLESYMLTRDSDSGMYTCIDLIELAAGIDLPQQLRDDEHIVAMRRLCARHVAFANDMMSYDKEVRGHANPSNLIHLLMSRRELGFDEAALETVAIINGDLREFQRLEAALPHWGGPHDSALRRYVDGMHRWMRGNIDWSLASLRYCTPNNPFPELRAGYHRAVALVEESL